MKYDQGKTPTGDVRDVIAEASWEHYEHGEHPAYCDLDELAPNAKRWELERADAILAALHDAGYTIRPEAGTVTISRADFDLIWDAADEHLIDLEDRLPKFILDVDRNSAAYYITKAREAMQRAIAAAAPDTGEDGAR